MPNDNWATEQFAPVCRGEGMPVDVSLSHLVVLIANNGGQWAANYPQSARRYQRESHLPWEAVLCLDHENTLVGNYVGAGGFDTGARAYARTTSVTLIRVSDGQRFRHTTATAQPDRTSQVYGRQWGTTHPEILEWLQEMARDNP